MLWVFGYGSLLHRPGFPFSERVRARVHGFARRFWQGSPDHRGTPDRPGRVVTLVAEEGSSVEGFAYAIPLGQEDDTLELLDEREQAGYVRHRAAATFPDRTEEVLTYLAPPGNPSWLGPASVDAIAAHVAGASGPSGTNRDYVLRLAETLREAGIEDPHVAEIERAVLEGP